MNIEQLREEYSKARLEYRRIKEEYEEIEAKMRSIGKLISSLEEYELGLKNTFTGPVNSLEHFLKSDNVILDKNLYCREKVFITAFNDHCRESHFAASKWTNQFYERVFNDYGIKVERNLKKRYPNNCGEPSYTGTWIIGVDIIKQCVNSTE